MSRIRTTCVGLALVLILSGCCTSPQSLSGPLRESKRVGLWPVFALHKEASDTAVQTHGTLLLLFSWREYKSLKAPAVPACGVEQADVVGPMQTASQ